MRIRPSKVFATIVLAAAALAPTAGTVREPALVLATVNSSAGAPAAAPLPVALVAPHPEQMLLGAIDAFRGGNLDRALAQVENLVDAKPNFRLAHLVYGDLLATRAGRPAAISGAAAPLPSGSLEGLVAEARQRWKRKELDFADRVPASLLQLDDAQRHAILVDLEMSRLFVYRNEDGTPVLQHDFYVSGGRQGVAKRRQGDKKTPLGVYFVTERLPGADLPDKYGPVAFPVNYPNEWDRRHRRTGSGIWLHGVPSNTYSRPPLDSDGCVALANEELSRIEPLLVAGLTPVVLAHGEQWLTAQEQDSRRVEINAALEAWRADWSSGDVDRYLSHYADDFEGRGMNKVAWSAYKRDVAAGKLFIDVELASVSIFSYPGESEMAVVTFRQNYRSNNFATQSRKRQYWRRDVLGTWRIVSEEQADTG